MHALSLRCRRCLHPPRLWRQSAGRRARRARPGYRADAAHRARVQFSETSFVLPARDPAHTAEVRIFTPDREVPSPGIPMSARRWCWRASWRRRDVRAGRVRVRRGGRAGADRAAARRGGREWCRVAGAAAAVPARPGARGCGGAGLAPGARGHRDAEHAPQVVSVGLTFLVVQLASRVALRRASPDPAGYAALPPLDDARSIYAYTTDTAADTGQGPTDIQARMFTGRMTEDRPPAAPPATALRAALRGAGTTLRLRVGQAWTWGAPACCTPMRRSDRTACGRAWRVTRWS